MQIADKYAPQQIESKWYDYWIEQHIFHSEPDQREPYTIVIPPPNVTGVLHLGHVLNNTIQDILVRRARQKGYEALWLPGTDHAGIATQVRVEKALKQTTGRSRHDLGREAFLEKVWEWKEKHGGIIINQLHKLGCSCDWDRERFTMDEEYTKAVGQVFIELFKEGLIYRGRRMVNWCPVSLTALSDEEVIMTEQKSKLYTVLYKLEDGSGALHVATTRPETIMADVAVAVNPKDPRYAHLIGKNVMRPLNPTPIPIIGDEYVEIEFGTGALKITPAHDKADFEIGRKFNLEIIDILTPDGHINCPEVPELHGMDRFDARRKSVEMLEASGLMVNIEDYDNKVGFSERANVPIEPRLSMQWFLKYPCVKEAADAVAGGDITFRPARWAKTYAHWLENIQDWCISRQLWWGHRIPVWYRKDKAEELRNAPALDASALEQGFLYVGTEPPQDPDNWIQDNDVMDTWFSSWLWPFSTMDEETRAKFYPTTDLVTGPDIIFFWVARMIMAGYRFQHDKPFSNVFFTSIIRDKIGRKMSKSLGNSPDPLDLIANYGADGLRFGLMRIAPTGTDVRFDENQISEGRNFANKLWNASRFVQMNLPEDFEPGMPAEELLDMSDKWVLSELARTAAEVTANLDKYELGLAAEKVENFIWDIYCDWYIEICKSRLNGEDAQQADTARKVLVWVLDKALKLLHPFMPFITEEIYQALPGSAETIMTQEWPDAGKMTAWPQECADFEVLMDYIKAVRTIRNDMNVHPAKKTSMTIETANPAAFQKGGAYLARFAFATDVALTEKYTGTTDGVVTVVTPAARGFIPMMELIDREKELKRLHKELEKAEKEANMFRNQLNNPKFVERAPEKLVNETRTKLAASEDKIANINQSIQALG